MYKLCKTEQSTQRQREIERSLLDLMSKKNYNDITITELCDGLDMPRKTFYRYFDSKDGALYALIEHTMFEYFTSQSKSVMAERILKRELEQFFDFWLKHREFLKILDDNGLLGKIIDVSVYFPINDMIVVSKFLPDDSDWTRERIFKYSICLLIFQMIDWYRDDFSTSVSGMAELSCRLLSRPLFPNLESIGIISG